MAKVKVDERVNQMDCLGDEARAQTDIERIAGGIARFYGFERFLPSPLEALSSFSPLVRAGLMEWRPPVICGTRSGEEFILAPSGALAAVRAYFSHRMQALPHPVKLFYGTHSFFILARSQRNLNVDGVGNCSEWGVVVLGEESTVAEIEIVQVLYKAVSELGLDGGAPELRLNATGCGRCRPSFRSSLSAYFRSRASRMCPGSRRDLKRAPTKILSCAEERCRQAAASAPQVLDFLCERCKKQLRSLLEFLDEARIPYFLDTRLFREGSWFGEIVFELLRDHTTGSPQSEAPSDGQNPADEAAAVPAMPTEDKLLVAMGGRLSQAAQILGGRELHVASGVLMLDTVGEAITKKEDKAGGTEVFFVQLGELAKRKSFELLEALRKGGIEAKESLGRDSIKAQLKIAERTRARFALILGQKEALDQTVIVREVDSGIQETVQQEKLIDFLKRKLKK